MKSDGVTVYRLKKRLYIKTDENLSFQSAELYTLSGMKTGTVNQVSDGIDISSISKSAYILKLNSYNNIFIKPLSLVSQYLTEYLDETFLFQLYFRNSISTIFLIYNF